MAKEATGNIKGLSPSELKAIKKLFGRRIEKNEIISLDFGREIYLLAAQLKRRIGVLVSREGIVEEVCVGTKEILYLPDLGRYRLGRSRLRALRLVFSDLSDKPSVVIPQDIYTDLEKLRLDLVAGIKYQANRTMLSYAHIVPQQGGGDPSTLTVEIPELSRDETDFEDLIASVEAQLSRQAAQIRVSSRPGVVLVGVYKKGDPRADASMAELKELSRTAGVDVLDVIAQKRDPDPKTVIGKGKLEEVVLRCLRVGAEMIIFDLELKPSQWRAITNLTELKVIDRSMLILDIFAQRATSSEGRLQVELAQLKYTLPRLVEKDSGLSRLSGGIGGRGPGETKLEIGRRRIRDKIVDLEKQIEKLGENRYLKKSRRMEREIPLVSILGYTNVGKSTLFNALTGSSVLVENKLFATLDPAQRQLVMPKKVSEIESESSKDRTKHADWFNTVILSDTVGFIRDLPAELMTAFRATLDELKDAKVMVHVIDASDPAVHERKSAVDAILNEMGLSATPVIVALNKTDRVSGEQTAHLAGEFNAIPISAITRSGLDVLKDRISGAVFTPDGQVRANSLPPIQGKG